MPNTYIVDRDIRSYRSHECLDIVVLKKENMPPIADTVTSFLLKADTVFSKEHVTKSVQC